MKPSGRVEAMWGYVANSGHECFRVLHPSPPAPMVELAV
jgi:hypothetical protein